MSGQDFPTKNTDVGTLPKKVGPQDFERIKLIGQGDVGKVYLVRLKDDKPPDKNTLCDEGPVEAGDDFAEQAEALSDGA